ncbi:MAG TPA: hypothetical protein VHX62_11115 [Solirubrobacteraceae bacterium]|nr:hypothetical protein [Solirubrobacteraceae bacterium]
MPAGRERDTADDHVVDAVAVNRDDEFTGIEAISAGAHGLGLQRRRSRRRSDSS